MNIKQIISNGWVQALFSVLVLWGLNNVMIGYSSQILNANYIVYTCSAFVSCAFFLLLISGKGTLAKETIKSIDTWAYGAVMLLGYVVTLSLFSYVSSTEGSLLQRSSLFFGVFLSWAFLHRTPTKLQIIGVLFVLLGIAFTCLDLPVENRNIIYMLMLLEGLILTARILVAEVHRPNEKAKKSQDSKAEMRVVGFTMFIISAFFLVTMSLVALLQSLSPNPIENGILPTLESFQHTPSIIAGLFAGVFLLAPLRLVEFSSSSICKTENFVALASLSCASTFFWEWVFSPLTGMSLKGITENDLIAGVIIILGCSLFAISGAKKTASDSWDSYLKFSTSDIQSVDDSKQLIIDSLEHFNYDYRKVSEALELPEEVVKLLVDDDFKDLAFKDKVLHSVSRAYRENVATSDSLTGLLNRKAFRYKVNEQILRTQSVTVLFIDLNKFKAINDTHGHEVGDMILKGVSLRLDKVLPAGSLASRLGGDEFCLMLSSSLEVEKTIESLKGVIGQPFYFDDIPNALSVGASIGVAVSPENGTTADDLINHADKTMYQDKRATR